MHSLRSHRYKLTWNRAGLGSGIFGFSAGLWPALFSFYNTPLINASAGYDDESFFGLAGSYYLNAVCIFASSVPAMLFLCDPSEYPLVEDENVEGVENVDDLENDDDVEETKPTPPPPPQEARKMTRTEIFKTLQLYIQWAAVFFAVIPGFALSE